MTVAPPSSVCILISDLDGEGGMQRQTRRLAGLLAEAGSRVSIITRNYRALPREERQGSLVIRRTPVAARPDPRSLDGTPPFVSRAALTSLLYLGSGFIWAFRRRKQYDVIHCQQMFGSMLLGMALRLCTGRPVVVRVTLSGERGEAAQVRRMPLASLRLRLVRKVDHWVALTREMSDELQGLGIPPGRITIIPNAAPLPEGTATDPAAHERARQALGAEGGRRLVYAGRLSAEKGLDTLLSAMPQILRDAPDAVLSILGGGGAFGREEAALRRTAETLGVAHAVRFEGFVDDVTTWLLAADVFVLPSKSEGMSNALVEAMAAGNAIVTTDLAAHREVVEDGVNARVVRSGDPDDLARAVTQLLRGRELRARLGTAARRTAAEKYSLAVMRDAYLSVYRAAARTEDRPRATAR